MRFPSARFWIGSKIALWSVDLLLISAIALTLTALELYLRPFKLPGIFLIPALFPVVSILVLRKIPPSRWIFPRWFRVIAASRKRRQLAKWHEVNKAPLSKALLNEPWFKKPS